MKKSTKMISVLLITIFIIIISPITIKASSNVKVVLEDKELIFDVPPQIILGRTLLPLRVIFEDLGLAVNWDNETRTITGKNEINEIILKLDSVDAKVNGIDRTLDVPAKAINGRTLVPVRFIAESLNMNVVWNQESKTVKISKNDIIEWKYEGYEGIEPFREYEIKYVNGVKTQESRFNGNKRLPFKLEIEKDYTKNVFGANVTNVSDTNYLSINFVSYFYNKNSKNLEEDKTSLISIKAKEKKWHSFYNNSFYFSSTNPDEYLYLGSLIESYTDYKTPYSTVYKNNNYEIEKKDLLSLQSINKAIDNCKSQIAELNKDLSQEKALNNGVPLKITNISITYNSIGIPEANISFKNVSNKTIDALELTIKCYDSYGRVVKELISNEKAYYGIAQNRSIMPGTIQGGTWTLNLFNNTTKAEAFVTSVHYIDGTVWKK